MKKNLFLLATIISIFLLNGSEAGGIEGKEEKYVPVEVLDKIKGTNFRLIQLAMPEFLKTSLKLEKYNIVVVTVKGKPGVVFEEDGSTFADKGGSFEVVLSEDGSRVERAYFGR
jgi:hypothetical protein